MQETKANPSAPLRIALVAHDAKKDDLIEWVGAHLALLEEAKLVGTGTTGSRILKAYPTLNLTPLFSARLAATSRLEP